MMYSMIGAFGILIGLISSTPTPEAVYDYCIEQGIQEPEVVTAQAILETGWFDCEYCSLDGNNIFGFWYNDKYLNFDNWQGSVEYYKTWQDRRYKGGDYYTFLKDVGYATDTEYVIKLKQIVNHHSASWKSE